MFHSLARVWHFIVASLALAAMAAHGLLLAAGLPADGPLAPANLPLVATSIIGGIPLAIEIGRKLVVADFGADFLAVLSLATALVLGEYLAATLVLLMLSGGQALETFAERRASSVLSQLANRMPERAHRRENGAVRDVPPAEIAIGDEIVVFPHEAAPVDGTVIEGHGSMDEAYLTGEPYRIAKAPGANVLSGAINGDVVLVIRADRPAAESRYARIMAVMQEAEQRRPQLRRLGDQLGAWFTPLALAVAALAWGLTGDADRFLAVLVVATPCPLLIAIPITVISAISMAAKRAIVIRDPTVLERLPTCRTAIFDKTGTLTYGAPKLTETLTADGVDAARLLLRVASLERYSKHPLASAVLEAAEAAGLNLAQAEEVSEQPGRGLAGLVDGVRIEITHRAKLAGRPEILAYLPDQAAGLECVVLVDGAYAATLRFRDEPRADGHSFIAHLGPRHQFRKVMLVSGDRASEVTYLAGMLGISDTLASQSPEEKLTVVRAETAKSPTLFMGDGINDAPALAAATVGLAFGQVNAATAEAAGAVLLDGTLTKVDELLHLSLAMRRIALQSAVGGMVLSLIGMTLASAGYLPPVAGALAQEAIDVVAILNALRLIWGERVDTDIDEPARPA